ncbi:hypothetical protein Tco_0579103 [Tanacetum coccineum]
MTHRCSDIVDSVMVGNTRNGSNLKHEAIHRSQWLAKARIARTSSNFYAGPCTNPILTSRVRYVLHIPPEDGLYNILVQVFGTDYLEFFYWLALKFDNYWEIDKNTQNGLWEFYVNERTKGAMGDLDDEPRNESYKKECSDMFNKPYLDTQDAKDIYEIIDREYTPIPIPAPHDIDNPDKLCKTKEFTVVRHSIGNDEEFVIVSPSKICALERTPGSMSCIYHELFSRKDRGWECAGDVLDFRTCPGISLETSIMSTMDLDGVTCLTVIMESLVKKKQKGAILELKRRHLKNTIFCTYTPYPAMKIRRISASSAQETRNDQFPIRRIHYNQYAVCTAVHQSKIRI